MLARTLITSCIVGLIVLGTSLPTRAQELAWERTVGEVGPSVRTLFASSSGYLFAATDSTLLRSSDGGASWHNSGPAGVNDVAEDASTGTLFVAGYHGVHRSRDDGQTWVEVLPEPVRDTCRDVVQLYDVFASKQQVLVVGIVEEGNGNCKFSGKFFRSINEGETWTHFAGFTHSRAILASDANTIFAVETLKDGGVLRSKDGGASWERVLYREDFLAVDLVLRPTGDIFLGTGELTNTEGSGIYRSTDEGDSWQPVNTGLTDTNITDLALYPNGTLLAATLHGGVHRSSNGGATWQALNAGLPTLHVSALAVTVDGFVFAATPDGIYHSVRPIATDVDRSRDVPETYKLEANYPNPFNPTTTIRYALPVNAKVNLRVYDALGREVATLVQGNHPAGEHLVHFDATNLPSGTYLYRLEANTFRKTGVMILAK